MIPTPTPEQITWLGMLALLVGVLVRLLKADTLNTFLARFDIPPIPKVALPWLALFLGFSGGVLEAKTHGVAWGVAMLSGVWGIVSGTIAIGGNETLPTVARAVSPAASNVVFGKDAGAGQPPPNRSIKPPMMPVLLMTFFLTLGGCAAVMAALPTVIAAVTDGMMVLDQIQTFMDKYFRAHPDKDKQETVDRAIAKTRAALNFANRTSAGAHELDQSKVDAAFADFRAAYKDLLTVVGPLGVRSADAMGIANGPGPDDLLYVPEPAAMTLKVSR